ncbi:hypothetical protein [Burkholderia sp. MSMB1498]|uniref:hypothetical protein n=1 Tax=Burkholderia sp. MSMB1498 TaxID=1637842 RepID=UPI0012E38C0E|nr:hypothetical protein [Burkholderia sp. MSMB1498]
MSTSLTTKIVEKARGSAAGDAAARLLKPAWANGGSTGGSHAMNLRALLLCRPVRENVAGSIAWAADAQDIHTLDHKNCGKAARPSSMSNGRTARGSARVARAKTSKAVGDSAIPYVPPLA